ncbi:MAG: UDP-N-acetylglucosamine 2-epimerase (non-hydrolyzing) [Elusimicrobia bacterium]|nr:UDP-N-acetylglucosamine 2-epimerase (non-hydrolyzing) [Elusimicrobiota bacterium]
MTRRLRILAVLGTRPEAVKLAPLLRRLRGDRAVSLRLCASAQHRELLDQMLKVFGLRPHEDLDLMRPGQTPSSVLARLLPRLDRALAHRRPDLLLVQGDTTTALGAALAAFHRGVPVAHLEAGLRTGDLSRPFPEEANRILIDRLSALLLAPTPGARRNLLAEGAPAERIAVTGNTTVDAVLWAARRPRPWRCRALAAWTAAPGPIVLVTLHRRESFGAPLRGMLNALLQAARRDERRRWVFPVHPTPPVARLAPRLLRHPRILLTPPLDYLDCVRLMRRCEAIVTDSGGIQEEAPSLGKPVFILRDKTERPEALGRGSRLVGTGAGAVARALAALRRRGVKAPRGRNPFGDGRAAARAAAAIRHWAGLGPRPADFR